MSEILDSISIQGYKSIRDLPPFELRNINVLIGSNGAGKSNFVSFFRMLRELFEQRLQTFLAQEGGADACLYLGPQETRELKASLRFGKNGYEFTLVPTADGRLAFSSELTIYRGHLTSGQESKRSLGSGQFEAQLKTHKDDSGVRASRDVPHYVCEALSGWVVYYFHDTSQFSKVRRPVRSTTTKSFARVPRTWQRFSFASSKRSPTPTERSAMLSVWPRHSSMISSCVRHQPILNPSS